MLRTAALARGAGNRVRLRAATVALGVALGALVPLGAQPLPACAAGGPRAVLVVDREDGSRPIRMCVSLPDDEVSGLELIELAADQYGLQYRFGHGGQAVCQLEHVPAGDPPSDCLRQGDPFWGYWRGDAGAWRWSGTGAGMTTVENGDVEGWAFGYGNDGSNHPQPPPTGFSDVCPQRRPPDPKAGSGERKAGGRREGGRGDGNDGDEKRSGPRGGKPRSGPTSTGEERGAAPAGGGRPGDRLERRGGGDGASTKDGGKFGRPSGKKKDRDAEPDKVPAEGVDVAPAAVPSPLDLTTPTPSALSAGPTSAQDEDAGGFPVAGLAALVAAAIMAGAAAFIAVKKPRGERVRGAR